MVTMDRIQMTRLARPTLWHGRVALVAKPGDPNTGVGRYVRMLRRELRAAGVDSVRIAPVVPPLPGTCYNLLGRLGMDVKAFLLNYPVWVHSFGADVSHLTSQNLASLLLFCRPAGR